MSGGYTVILQVARPLEVVQEKEKFHSRGHKPSNQTHFSQTNDQLPDSKQLVKDMLAHLGLDGKSGQSVRKQPPTPGPKRVRSTERILKPLPILPRVHHPGKGGEVDLLLQKDDPAVEMDHSVTAVKGMDISSSNLLRTYVTIKHY